MSFETKLVYGEPLLRQAVFGFWRRTIGVRYPVALGLMAIGLAWLILQGETSWAVGALGAVLGLSIVMAATVYIVHYRNTMRKLREMTKPEATFRADESTFTISSSIGISTLQWSTVKELWQLRDVWLILFSRAQFVTLPTACLPAEMQAFILERVKSAGGKVS